MSLILEQGYGRRERWVLFACLCLASYMFALDVGTTHLYLAFAASSLGAHSFISTVQVVQSITTAIGRPVIAKFADATSRGTAFAVVLAFYVVGYTVIASARNVQSIAGGTVLYSLGSTGLRLLIQVVVADMTALKWRGLVAGLVFSPLIINSFVGAKIAAAVLDHATWRWGYGMLAVLIPVMLFPLIVVLLLGERKAKRMVAPPIEKRHPLGRRLLDVADKMDLIGLILLGSALSFVLLPLTINRTVRGGWHNASIIAMLVVGCALFVVFSVWDAKFARYPVVSRRFLRNRSIVGASLIGFFDFASFYLTFTYLFSYVFVVKDWSLVNVNYFSSAQIVALSVFSIMAGGLLRVFHRYKAILTIGLLIRLLGIGIMIHSRGTHSSTAELVLSQLIQGLGGAAALVASEVGAQASVPRADVALATALVLLCTDVGSAIGNAIAGAIWDNTMPRNLVRFLPDTPQDVRAALYESVITVRARPHGDAVREGVILAYGETMKVMLIVAAAIAVVPIALSFIMPNWVLGDEQNAVSGIESVDGKEAQESKA